MSQISRFNNSEEDDESIDQQEESIRGGGDCPHCESPGLAKVLFVDDDTFVQFAYRLLIQNMNLKAHIVSNGEEALQALDLRDQCPKHQQYQLVLMDINMPVMNGITAMAKIKQNRYRKGKPFCIATSAIGERDFDCNFRDFDEVSCKPITQDKLVGFLNKLRIEY